MNRLSKLREDITNDIKQLFLDKKVYDFMKSGLFIKKFVPIEKVDGTNHTRGIMTRSDIVSMYSDKETIFIMCIEITDDNARDENGYIICDVDDYSIYIYKSSEISIKILEKILEYILKQNKF